VWGGGGRWEGRGYGEGTVVVEGEEVGLIKGR